MMRRTLITVSGIALACSAWMYAAAPSSVAEAAMQGNRDAVRTLLKDGADVNTAMGDGMTALHYAAARHDVDLAKLLLYAGANVKATTRIGGYTPLLIASRDGDAAMIEALVGAGADANGATANGATPLMLASAAGSADAVRSLLAHGANVNAKESVKGETAMTFAAAYGRADVIKELAARGGDVNVHTKVQDLAEFAKEEQARLLAERGQLFGQPPAAQAGRAGGAGRGRAGEPAAPAAAPTNAAAAPAANPFVGPLQPGAQPPAAEAAGQNAQGGQGRGGRGGRGGVDPAKQIPGLDRQYNYTEQVAFWGGLAPIHLAARQGQRQAVAALLAAHANINEPTLGDHATPMLIAIINGQFDLAKDLLDKGAEPNMASENGVTPLYAVLNCQWAAKALYPQPRAQEQQQLSYLQLMDALLQKGANPNARLTKKVWYAQYDFDQSGIDETGSTPFWRAAYASDIDAMKLLVKWGADPNMWTIRTPGRVRTGDADRQVEDVSGMAPVPVGAPAIPPLLAAAGQGYGEGFAANHHRYAPTGMLAAVKYLIEELHVDVNARDHEGNTAIHNAAARGDNEMIQYLVSKGADPKLVNRAGQTTVDMANGPVQRISPFPETIKLLEGMGVKNNHKCVSC
jgi:ankyrin repeat protein